MSFVALTVVKEKSLTYRLIDSAQTAIWTVINCSNWGKVLLLVVRGCDKRHRGVGWGFMINGARHLGFGRRKIPLYWALLVNLDWLCWRQARYTWYSLWLEPSKIERTLSGLVCYSLSQSQDVVAFKATIYRQGICYEVVRRNLYHRHRVHFSL